ncbi:hypothetical protein [uncultured Clostridium sp.]|uniref:hypothetical protein n=1 Tax=uncultured Clostridium sp. TaxID=59620 RepID=UPI00261DBDC5|nr:hypothetical protein [uncultured Clostridium sp.]
MKKEGIIEEIEEVLECVNPFASTKTSEEESVTRLVFARDGKGEKEMEEVGLSKDEKEMEKIELSKRK